MSDPEDESKVTVHNWRPTLSTTIVGSFAVLTLISAVIAIGWLVSEGCRAELENQKLLDELESRQRARE